MKIDSIGPDFTIKTVMCSAMLIQTKTLSQKSLFGQYWLIFCPKVEENERSIIIFFSNVHFVFQNQGLHCSGKQGRVASGR